MIFGSIFKKLKGDNTTVLTLKKKEKKAKKRVPVKKSQPKKSNSKKKVKPKPKVKKPGKTKQLLKSTKRQKSRPPKKLNPKRTALNPVKRKESSKAKEILIGEIKHYFGKVKAGVIKLDKAGLAVGDSIRIKGSTSDFTQKIVSLEIDNQPVERAAKGKQVGFKSKKRVRIKDKVYKIEKGKR
jgi:hypothetical protein